MTAPARIAARLRERLPAESFRVVEGADCADVFNRPHGAWTGHALVRRREWGTPTRWLCGSVEGGPGWPERLADALADALLGAPR